MAITELSEALSMVNPPLLLRTLPQMVNPYRRIALHDHDIYVLQNVWQLLDQGMSYSRSDCPVRW